MKCDRCPMGEGLSCAGEAGKWAGLACKMADGSEAGELWIAARSGVEAPAPPPLPAYPPFATQAMNLAKAALRFARSGFRLASWWTYRRRRRICRACPTGRYDAKRDRCRACGCHAALKPWSRAESCPDGHW